MNVDTGKRIYNLADRLFPICRSITGDGVRSTLKIIDEYIGESLLNIKEIPSGKKVFDWTVPKEWRIRDAYIEDESGKHIIDFKDNNLYVMGYSLPVDKWVDLDELKEYIYSIEDQPEWIPYVTSYYKQRYGFCMSDVQKKSLQPGRYHMLVDSELFEGSLTYGELIIPGESDEEVFFSTYICHPSMANNECSGPALSAELIRYVMGLKKRRYTYRFVFVPETIGAITYLSENIKYMKEHIIAGFNLSCVGDDRTYSILNSRYGNTLADKVLDNVLKYRGDYKKYSYLDRGSDERQYCSPGVDLPVVGFSRSKYLEYPEYHTSADNMDLVSPEGFQGAYDVMREVIDILESNYIYKTTVLCEPQLGKRGLFPTVSKKGIYDTVKIMTNCIAYADGTNDIIDISNIIKTPVKELLPIAKRLYEEKLFERI